MRFDMTSKLAALGAALLLVPAAGAGAAAEPAADGAAPVVARAPEPPVRPWLLSGSVGAGSAYGRSYLLLGVKVGREVAPSLVLDVEGQWWAGGAPSIGKVAPGLTWYAPGGLYLGGYYARWLVGGGRPDQDAVGGRAGLALGGIGPTSSSVGVAYERALDCRSACESWWPEVAVALRF